MDPKLRGQTALVTGGRDPDDWPQLLGRLPFDRPGEPEEVADAVTLLASPRAGYVSGTIVTVDAGHSVAR